MLTFDNQLHQDGSQVINGLIYWYIHSVIKHQEVAGTSNLSLQTVFKHCIFFPAFSSDSLSVSSLIRTSTLMQSSPKYNVETYLEIQAAGTKEHKLKPLKPWARITLSPFNLFLQDIYLHDRKVTQIISQKDPAVLSCRLEPWSVTMSLRLGIISTQYADKVISPIPPGNHFNRSWGQSRKGFRNDVLALISCFRRAAAF